MAVGIGGDMFEFIDVRFMVGFGFAVLGISCLVWAIKGDWSDGNEGGE